MDDERSWAEILDDEERWQEVITAFLLDQIHTVLQRLWQIKWQEESDG